MTELQTGLRNKLEKVATATSHTYYSGYVPDGQKWFLSNFSVWNGETNDSRCIVSIELAGSEYALRQFEDIEDKHWNNEDVGIWLFPGERISFFWEHVTAADPLKMVWHGHRKIEN